jgi:hypothetical protein
MSTLTWKGDAPAVAQVDTLTVGGTIEASDVFTMTINGKSLNVVAGSTAAATVATTIATAWNASTIPEFKEITAAATSGGSLTLTADVPGKPFTVTVSTTETGGGAADAQTFTKASTTANSGPNDWSTAANWSGGAIPANSDIVILENSKVDILYGLDQHGVTLASLIVAQTFTGTIGLPRTNAGGYAEYRPTYLQIGATLCTIGKGDGAGSGRIKIDFYSIQTACTIQNSGSAAETGLPSILLKGTHASNVLNLIKGNVGVAFFAGETATLATVNVGFYSNVNGDSSLVLGSGCTLTTVKQSGGKIAAESNITTLTQYAGELTLRGSATLTTYTIEGVLYDESTGTFTTGIILGKYNRQRSMAAKTCTTITLYKGCEWHDPFHTVTITNGLVLSQCTPEDITLDIAPNLTLTLN